MNSKFNLDTISRNFQLILEGQQPDATSYAAVVLEILNALHPASQRDKKYINVAKAHLGEINKHVRRLQERVNVLEEQVRVLEENKKPEEK